MAPNKTFAIVVVGDMNPRLHHPAWYKSVGLLSEEEEAAALANPFLLVPQFAQFDTGSIECFCDGNRWQIRVAEGLQQRAVEIADVVFDQRLKETPITAYGLNFDHHEQTASTNVGETLGRMLASLPFGFERSDGCVGRVSFLRTLGDGTLRCSIEPSANGDDTVYVGFNAHYELKSVDVPEHFELRALLDSTFPVVQQTVIAQLQKVLSALNKAVEK